MYMLENNPVGIQLDVQSGVFIVGGLNVVGNEIGLLADGANTVSIISIPPNPSRITAMDTKLILDSVRCCHTRFPQLPLH